MRILIVGADSEYSIERFYLKYFNEEMDVVAELFQAQNIFLKYYKRHLFNKVLFRLGYISIYQRINEQLKSKLLEFKPDIVFIFKGMEVLPKLIVWAKQRGIKLANYNPDNPFIFTGRGSGNKNVSKAIELFDFHFTYNFEVKALIDEKYHIPTYMLPFGFDIPESVFNENCHVTEIHKACFVGSPDNLRAKYLNQLANEGVEIDVYGSNWSKFSTHKNIDIFKPIYGNQLWKILRSYRIQLNPLRIHNLQSHAMRSFEVPSIGGIMLAPSTPDHHMFFKDGKEAFYYSDIGEALIKIKYILGITRTEADKIRAAAIKRSIISGYHYKDRAKYVLQIFKMYLVK